MTAGQENLPDDLTPFQLRGEREILRLIHSVSTKRELLTVRPSNSDTVFRGHITGVDEDMRTAIFCLDEESTASDPSPAFPQPTTQVDVEGTLDSVKISFQTTVAGDLAENSAGFAINLPDRIVRLQRREFYRVQVPSHPPVRCRISAGGANDPVLLTHIRNLSSGGAMLLDPTGVISAEPGTVYRKCVLELPGFEAITCALRLCNLYDASTAPGKVLGMQFVDMPARSLSIVQRYAAKLEISQRPLAGR